MGRRYHPPNWIEFQAVRARKTVMLPVQLADHRKVAVEADSSLTAAEVCRHIATDIGLRDQFGFAIYISIYDKVPLLRTSLMPCLIKAAFHYSSHLQTWLQTWFTTRFAAMFSTSSCFRPAFDFFCLKAGREPQQVRWFVRVLDKWNVEKPVLSKFAAGFRPGMGSSGTVLELEDSSRTQNRGLGLGL